ncbi:MAG TPA: universal stress protein [Puia sp.]|nr:universal stress protein [Puia sp.]
MNNILLLTDFSEASLHAGQYAALLTHQLRSQRLMLYHAYEVMMPIPAADIPVSPASYPPEVSAQEGEELRRSSLRALQAVYDNLRGLAYEATIMEYRTEEANLGISINDIAKEADADLVIMAITDNGKLERMFLGNDAVQVADVSDYPVLVVPPSTPLIPIKRIVFAYDPKLPPETKHAARLKKLLDDLQAQVDVVNFDTTDPATNILEFATARKASLIIAIHKNRSFFERLFHRSTTHQLAYQTTIPLLVAHSMR